MKMLDPREFVRTELAAHNIHFDLGRPGRRRNIIWFDVQPGFGLRQYASGREIYFIQSIMQGRDRAVTICDARLISFRDALDIARRCIYHSPELPNPADARKRKRSTPLFQDFLEIYWQRVSPGWKPSTLATETQYRRYYLSSAFEKVGVDELSAEEVQAWMISANRRGSPGAANRAFERIRAAMNKAEEWGFREPGTNPCQFVKMNKRGKCKRYLSEVEFCLLGKSIEHLAKRFPLQSIVAKLLMTTGCRRNEIRCMKWNQVRGDRLFVEDGKTGPRTVRICSEARVLLDCLKRGKPEEFVFASSTGNPVGMQDFWTIARKEAGLQKLRLHDLRHSFASRAARLELPLSVIKELLGHSKIENTARYTHFNPSHLQEIADFISDLIEAAMTGNPLPTKQPPLQTVPQSALHSEAILAISAT